jgi:hypothetical protein
MDNHKIKCKLQINEEWLKRVHHAGVNEEILAFEKQLKKVKGGEKNVQ